MARVGLSHGWRTSAKLTVEPEAARRLHSVHVPMYACACVSLTGFMETPGPLNQQHSLGGLGAWSRFDICVR